MVIRIRIIPTLCVIALLVLLYLAVKKVYKGQNKINQIGLFDRGNAMFPSVNSILVDTDNAVLYVSGVFDKVNQIECHNLAKYDIKSNTWQIFEPSSFMQTKYNFLGTSKMVLDNKRNVLYILDDLNVIARFNTKTNKFMPNITPTLKYMYTFTIDIKHGVLYLSTSDSDEGIIAIERYDVNNEKWLNPIKYTTNDNHSVVYSSMSSNNDILYIILPGNVLKMYNVITNSWLPDVILKQTTKMPIIVNDVVYLTIKNQLDQYHILTKKWGPSINIIPEKDFVPNNDFRLTTDSQNIYLSSTSGMFSYSIEKHTLEKINLPFDPSRPLLVPPRAIYDGVGYFVDDGIEYIFNNTYHYGNKNCTLLSYNLHN